MVGIVSFVALAGGVITFAGEKYLSNKAKQIIDMKLEVYKLNEQQKSLTNTEKTVEKYKIYNSIAETVLPRDKDQARAIREIVQIGEESDIPIQSVTFAASSLGNKSSTGSSSQAPISQATAVEGITGLYQLKLTVIPESKQSGYSYYSMLNFLEKIEKNRRTAQVNQVSITRQGNGVNFQVELAIFIKPDTLPAQSTGAK